VEYRDTLGAEVNANGACRYSVFRNAAGKRAIVIVNTEPSKEIAVHVAIDGPPQWDLVAVSPEEPDARPIGRQLQIPSRSVLVVIEQ